MSQEHEWIYEYDSLTINSNKYFFRCYMAMDRKSPNNTNPSLQLTFKIWNDTKGLWINWNDFKGSYLAEKFIDYVKNTMNRQCKAYWDNKYHRDFTFSNVEVRK